MNKKSALIVTATILMNFTFICFFAKFCESFRSLETLLAMFRFELSKHKDYFFGEKIILKTIKKIILVNLANSEN